MSEVEGGVMRSSGGQLTVAVSLFVAFRGVDAIRDAGNFRKVPRRRGIVGGGFGPISDVHCSSTRGTLL